MNPAAWQRALAAEPDLVVRTIEFDAVGLVRAELVFSGAPITITMIDSGRQRRAFDTSIGHRLGVWPRDTPEMVLRRLRARALGHR